MKSITRPIWTFLFVGIVIGAILVLQGKSGVPLESDYPLDELEAQKAVIESFINEQQKLETTLVSLRKKISEEEEKLSQFKKTAEQKKLEDLQSRMGLSPVSGSGVSVFLADSVRVDRETADPNDEALVSAGDVRDVLNLLFSSGATAIAVNGKRVLPLASVNFVGNTFLINDFHVFPPFTIQALGSQDVLSSRLKDLTLLPSLQKRVQQGRIRFFHQERGEIEIPAFDGTLKTNFLSANAPSQ